MINDQIEIRSIANRAELESVYDILGNAFPVGRDFFQMRLDHDSAYDCSTTWIALQQEAIASTIQVFPLNIRVEDTEVKVGGIGSVATVPEYQGKGYCKQMLHRLTEWMEQQEYDLSLLFAIITPFYEKSGWSTFPQTLYELNKANIKVNSSSNYDIRPFDPTHMDDISNIYKQFNETRTCTVIRPEAHWKDRLQFPKWKASTCFLAIRNGVAVAYGHISEQTEDGAAYLEELGYLKGEESAVVPLFHALVEQRPEVSRILAYLPEDHHLTEKLTSWGAEKKTKRYMMWKIIRLQPLLAKLAALFQKRLQNNKAYAGKSLQIRLDCAGQEAYIHYLDGQISIEADPRQGIEYSKITLTQEELTILLFQGCDNSNPEALHDPVLGALFPKQNPVFYNLDRF